MIQLRPAHAPVRRPHSRTNPPRRAWSPASARFAVSFVAAAVLAVAGAGIGHAQTGGDVPDAAFRPTRGLYIPGGARAGEADATAVELNPGQLPLLAGGAVAVVANAWRAEAAMPGRGGGLFFGAPLWKAGALALGLQGIAGSGAAAPSAHTKFQLGYGVGGRKFGLGVSWAHLFGGGLGGLDTFDAGLGWRPISRLAVALVLEDFARPRLVDAAERLPRRWVGELALRPTGTDRVELAAAGLHLGGDAWSNVGARFRGAVRLGGIWRLFADVEWAKRRGEVSPGEAATGSDWRLTAGVRLDLDHGSLAVAGRRSLTPSGVGGDNWGASMLWRGSTERNVPSAAGERAVRISVDGVDTEREFMTLALRLRSLARDNTTRAVLLKWESFEGGLGRLEELRDRIAELRRRGKKVIAYLTNASMRAMYLASACDRVVMHPAGGLTFAGLSQAVTFYKSAMERLGVNVELVRIAEYKGAMEPYIMTTQSEPVRKNRNELLDDVYARMLASIVAGRATEARAVVAGADPGAPLDGARLVELINVGTFSPNQAVRVGLVDAVHDEYEAEKYLRDLVGRPNLDIVDPDTAPEHAPRWVRPRVAVVMINGTITDGSSQRLPFDLGGVAGADSLVEALEECRRDPNVRAVVLRVNSPGGSAFSSDVIARAVARVRAAGKPVVASLGDVAASGGYYVSAPADLILAEPSTMTGSIGIFGFKVDLSRLLSMLSLNVEVLRRGPHADQVAPYRPWTPEERLIAERKIRQLYEMFLGVVAAGRKSRGLTPALVDRIGRGHVWTGAQARQIGLVDELGGLVEAVDRAAALGRIPLAAHEAPELVILPRATKSLLQAVAGLQSSTGGWPAAFAGTQGTNGGDSPSDGALGPASAPLPPAVRAAVKLLGPYLYGPGEGIEARMPYDIEVH